MLSKKTTSFFWFIKVFGIIISQKFNSKVSRGSENQTQIKFIIS